MKQYMNDLNISRIIIEIGWLVVNYLVKLNLENYVIHKKNEWIF